MAIKYYKLFDMMNKKDIKKTNLLYIMSGSTLTKLSKNEIIKTNIISKICKFLNCQPSDIIKYKPEQPKPQKLRKK